MKLLPLRSEPDISLVNFTGHIIC